MKRSALPPRRTRRNRFTPATSPPSWTSFAAARLRCRADSRSPSWTIAPKASFHAPEAWPLIAATSARVARLRPSAAKSFDVMGQTYVLGRAHVGDHGQILVAMPLPANYSSMSARHRDTASTSTATAPAAATAAPHLSGLPAAADGRRAVRLDLAGALSSRRW